MKLSAKGRYGIRAMIDLALHGGSTPISAKTIAERQDFSADYLEQIFRLLRNKGLVKSTRGPSGGFVLAQDPKTISVWDILLALEEPFHIAPCLDSINEEPINDNCKREESCAARLLWEKVGRDVKEVLTNATLEMIVSDARDKLKNAPIHNHMFHI